MTNNRRREEIRLSLLRRRCECPAECGRVADTLLPPIGWRGKGLPRDLTGCRAYAYQCAIEEQQQAA